MRGWIIDCHPDYDQDLMVLWARTESGVERLEKDFVPEFFVSSSPERLRSLPKKLRMLGLDDCSLERRWTGLGEREREVLRVPVRRYADLADMARTVDRWGGYSDHRLFNVDLRLDQRYFLLHHIFPMGLIDLTEMRSMDSPFRHQYRLPPLRESEMEVTVDVHGIPTFDDPLLRVRVDDVTLDGGEESVLNELGALIMERDPDIIYTDRGDDFYLQYLARRAEEHQVPLHLGREGGKRIGKSRSYFTYGRIVYKPPAYKLKGRMHIDRGQSFMFSESGLYGLIDLSRLSGIPLQDLSRLSPGSAISAMQVNKAMRTGHLILWKKNLPEDFKTARELMMCDRGGFIHDPVVGVHEGVTEVDFSSLYPNIMVRYNISPETLGCECCPRSSRRAPGIDLPVCERRKGLIPRVLEPLISRRTAAKRLAKEMPEQREVFEQRSKILKWVLVTCFGYMGYRNARFGRIECHEAITAYGREILMRSSELAREMGFRVLHGIVDSLWLSGEGDPRALCDAVQREFQIPLEIEGTYRWIVFLPCVTTGVGALNRYYGLLQSGEMKKRGIAMRRSDTPILVREMQGEMLLLLAKASDADTLLEMIPGTLRILDGYISRLRNGEIPLMKLVLTKRVSKLPEEYVHSNHSTAAIRQLESMGFRVPPGKSVTFVILDGQSKDPWKRVRVKELMEGDESYDAESYVRLAARATAELIAPFGWDYERVGRRLDLSEGKRV